MGYITRLRFTDLDTAINFYVDHLNASLNFRYEDFYAGLMLDGQMIHFKLVDDPDPNVDWVRQGNHLHLSLEVESIEALRDGLVDKGIGVSEISDQPWGREVQLTDPGGHTIYFRESPD